MRGIIASIAVAVSMSVACAGAPSTSQPAAQPKADRNTITHSQMETNGYQTAYDAVAALRSNWLLTRGTDSFQTPSEVRVYMDNVLLGGTETLRDVATRTVSYIHYYDGVAATARWGIGHGAGVIFISTSLTTAAPLSGTP